MTPAQRLAEWLDEHKWREVRVSADEQRVWSCNLFSRTRQFYQHPGFITRDEAITAALDAWQKGGG